MNCWKYYDAVLEYYPTPDQRDYSNLFYYMNYNYKNEGTLKL